MRVLLVQPGQSRTMGLQHLMRLEPLGLEMIGGALRNRHETVLLDQRVERDELGRVLGGFQPQLVGISCSFTVDLARTLQIARTVKEADVRTFVVVGGHHASLCPADLRDEAVDAVVIAEGESATAELADCLDRGADPSGVAGLWLNRQDGQQFTFSRPLVQDLDALPYPDRRLTRRYRRDYGLTFTAEVAALETARGCPYRCRFCSVWQFYQGRVRFKSPARVVRELADIQEPNVFITDDNFLAHPGRAADMARLIQTRGIRKAYTVQARSDAIVRYRKLVAQWKKVGLDNVFIGFERPDQAGLEAVEKHNTVQNNERALTILRDLGIEPVVSFIADPQYDRREFAALRAYIRRLKLKWPLFSVLTPLPGTALFEETKARLTTLNCELFDVLHAVLPTKLPLRDFYQELARLWDAAYPAWKLRLGRACYCLPCLRHLWSWHREGPHWRRVLTELSRLADAQAYVTDWVRGAAAREQDARALPSAR